VSYLSDPVKMSDILSDLLGLAGIKSKKKPNLTLIIENEPLEEFKVESFIEFVKLYNSADGFIITVEEPEISLRENFKTKLLEFRFRRENRDWSCRVNLEEQEITKDLLEKIKEVIKTRTDILVSIGLTLLKILEYLREYFSKS